MATTDTLALWEFPADAPYAEMAAIAQDRLEEPDARAVLVSNRSDVITLQVVEGRLSRCRDSRFYVERRGGFELLRREEWPPADESARPRVMLTLRAWPMRLT